MNPFVLFPASLSLSVILTVAALASEEATVQANSDFAFDLYAQLAKENAGENLFFSPYSVSSALAMTTEGARGETALQMGQVLRYPESTATGKANTPWNLTPIHSGMTALDARLNGEEDPAATAKIKAEIAALKEQLDAANAAIDTALEKRQLKDFQQLQANQNKVVGELNKRRSQIDQYELKVANALWAEKTYPFKDDYFAKISKFYQTGGIFPVDFKGDFKKVRLQINSWVEGQTNKRIVDLVPEGALDELTRLVLVNAIYFKGDWASPFEEKNTKESDFTLADGSQVRKPIMHAPKLEGAAYAAFNGDGSFFHTRAMTIPGLKTGYYPDQDGFAMVELPYKGDELSMLVVAPNDPGNLGEIEGQLNAANLAGWIDALKEREVHVHLPKFKSEAKYTLGDSESPVTLQKMGTVRAFTDPRQPEGAVFDGMSHAKSPTNKLYLTKVLHKAFVEVNEKGTEAAAASAVTMSVPLSARPEPFIPTFKADRPFIYLIRDKKSGSILFLGRMMEPGA